MEMDDFQKEALKTAIYPNVGNDIYYPTLGLVGEAGEVANKVKKIMRDKGGRITETDRVEIGKELGDILWYVAVLAWELKLKLHLIAAGVILKLKLRLEQNKIKGNGDNR